jgi:hypothetical protein
MSFIVRMLVLEYENYHYLDNNILLDGLSLSKNSRTLNA